MGSSSLHLAIHLEHTRTHKAVSQSVDCGLNKSHCFTQCQLQLYETPLTESKMTFVSSLTQTLGKSYLFELCISTTIISVISV